MIKKILRFIVSVLLGIGYFLGSFFMPQSMAYFWYKHLKTKLYEFIETV